MLWAVKQRSLLGASIHCAGILLFFPDDGSVWFLRNTGLLYHNREDGNGKVKVKVKVTP